MSDPRSFEDRLAALAAIPGRFAVPPPELVTQRKVQGAVLDYVGHADVTLWLDEVDPMWTWRPYANAADGSPLITRKEEVLRTKSGDKEEARLVMWGVLTLLGVETIEVGTCIADKFETDKELVGDFIRRAAMRRGFATALWSRAERSAEPPEDTAYEAAWQRVANQLRALPDDARDEVVRWAEKEGTFVGRKPVHPIPEDKLRMLEAKIALKAAAPASAPTEPEPKPAGNARKAPARKAKPEALPELNDSDRELAAEFLTAQNVGLTIDQLADWQAALAAEAATGTVTWERYLGPDRTGQRSTEDILKLADEIALEAAEAAPDSAPARPTTIADVTGELAEWTAAELITTGPFKS